MLCLNFSVFSGCADAILKDEKNRKCPPTERIGKGQQTDARLARQIRKTRMSKTTNCCLGRLRGLEFRSHKSCLFLVIVLKVLCLRVARVRQVMNPAPCHV